MSAPDGDLSGLTIDELRDAAEHCTELTCPGHGYINAEIKRRKEAVRAILRGDA